MVERCIRGRDRNKKLAPLIEQVTSALIERFNGREPELVYLGTGSPGGQINCDCPFCGMSERARWDSYNKNLKCPACSRRLSDAKCAEHIKSMGKKMPPTKSFCGYREVANRLKIADAKPSPLDKHADAIRSIQRRMAIDLIEIGKHLVAAKKRLDHGAFTPWLDRKFTWSDRTARLFMQVFETFGKTENFSDMQIGQSALYLLSAESTPEDATTEAIDRARAGEKITHTLAKEIVGRHAPHDNAAKTPAPAIKGAKYDRLVDAAGKLNDLLDRPSLEVSIFEVKVLAKEIKEIVTNET